MSDEYKARFFYDFLLPTLGWALVFIIAVGFLLLAGWSISKAECLHSAQEVWDAHPGSHATWSTRDDGRCWYAVHKHKRREARLPVPRPKPAVLSDGHVASADPIAGAAFADRWAPADQFADDQPGQRVSLDHLQIYGWRLWLAESVAKAELLRERFPPSQSPPVVVKRAVF
jgi:hypothetical protein